MSYSTIGYSLDRVQRPVGRGATSVHDVMCIDEAYPFYIYIYVYMVYKERAGCAVFAYRSGGSY